MTFEQFCKALLKRWIILVICIVLVGLGAYIGSSKFIKPTYQSSVLVEVSVRSGGDPLVNDNILASQQLSETEANLATTYPVLSAVVSRYPGMSVDDLTKEVTATTRSNTPLFDITVADHDPILAANLANDIAATLIKQQLQLTQPTPTPVVTTPGTPARVTPTQNKTTQSSFLVIAQSARPALTPARPNKLLNTAGGIAIGLLLGMLLAILLELLDTRVRTKESIVSLLGWSVLGTLTQTSSKNHAMQSSNYTTNADDYGALRANMGFVTLGKPVRTLVVTSGAPDEGKSLVATNLAISMAKAGKNTLLIDANLRHPTLYEQFAIPDHAMGFSNALLACRLQMTSSSAHRQSSLPATQNGQSSSSADQLSLNPFIRPANIPNLWVMPSGPLPPNPSELLDAKPMQIFFTALTQSEAEMVIFDAPSVQGVSDALLLASRADGTLVVVDINRARKGTLKQVQELLDQANAHILGCVVNKELQKGNATTYKFAPNNRRVIPANTATQRSTTAETASKPSEAPFKPEQKKQAAANDAAASSENRSKEGVWDETLTLPQVKQKKASD